MSQGQTIPLATAQKIAELIRSELAGYCAQIEIAGSVRRQRPHCSDIDLVLLPKDGLRPEIEARVRANPNTRVIKSGPQIVQLLLANGVQVDLYMARTAINDLAGYIPGNFGMRLLAMTGSREHNVWLAELAKQKGYHFAPYKGLMRGGRYAITKPAGAGSAKPTVEYLDGEVWRGESELEILRALGLGWIPPEAREIDRVNQHPREEAPC